MEKGSNTFGRKRSGPCLLFLGPLPSPVKLVHDLLSIMEPKMEAEVSKYELAFEVVSPQ